MLKLFKRFKAWWLEFKKDIDGSQYERDLNESNIRYNKCNNQVVIPKVGEKE
jgi:hypothetical protein